jgi:hypothetical protein
VLSLLASAIAMLVCQAKKFRTDSDPNMHLMEHQVESYHGRSCNGNIAWYCFPSCVNNKHSYLEFDGIDLPKIVLIFMRISVFFGVCYKNNTVLNSFIK